MGMLVCMGMSAFCGPPEPDEEMIELIHKAVEHVHKAVEHGVTLLDTSDVYGPYTNEILVGKFLLVFVSALYLNSMMLMKII
ncbi:hypothetical protein R1sor_018636 [Riccia sorocarpa]|uniref:NADP-dependent oxidoreductase domain-containing protein n=1 Tax=Riccia sorocarpa TaxID=122646 RepID=A0ABD3IBY5_9MARC